MAHAKTSNRLKLLEKPKRLPGISSLGPSTEVHGRSTAAQSSKRRCSAQLSSMQSSISSSNTKKATLYCQKPRPPTMGPSFALTMFLRALPKGVCVCSVDDRRLKHSLHKRDGLDPDRFPVVATCNMLLAQACGRSTTKAKGCTPRTPIFEWLIV